MFISFAVLLFMCIGYYLILIFIQFSQDFARKLLNKNSVLSNNDDNFIFIFIFHFYCFIENMRS